MDDYRKRLFSEVATLSKNILLLIFVLLICSLFSELLGIKWLTAIFGVLFLLAFFVSWITSGIFVILWRPWLAHAWLYGINPIMISSKPWTQLSDLAKIGISAQSLIMALFASVGLIMTITNTIEK